MSRLESTVSLLVASLDLKLVQLVRGAMLVADLREAAILAEDRRRDRFECYEDRRHYEPTPVYEPRRHIHPEPQLDTGPVLQKILPPVERLANEKSGSTDYVAPAASKSPIEPPWKVLPWQNPPAPPPKVKYVIHKPDSALRRGAFVNVFA